MKIQIKICGIRQLASAEAVISAGASYLGFNFYPPSSRHISVYKAKKIIDLIRGRIKIVGIFRNQPLNEVIEIVTYLNLDAAQLHGKESPEYASQVPVEVIKAFSLPADFTISEALSEMSKYTGPYYLLDREIQGTGKMLNLEKVAEVVAAKKIFLAGGLNSENVANVVAKTKPYGVDVASGIETNGKEDPQKIIQFVDQARSI